MPRLVAMKANEKGYEKLKMEVAMVKFKIYYYVLKFLVISQKSKGTIR